MIDSEPKGCLAAILSIKGIRFGAESPKHIPPLPYVQRDDFLSAAELSFYLVLYRTLGDRVRICPKVNLADVFFVSQPNVNQSYRNKIDRKHVDFLLCDPIAMKPKCGVELDDASHGRPDRQDRDVFVDRVFEVAGLPLVRVPAQAAYNPARLLSMLQPYLEAGAPKVLRPGASAVPPKCPKCGIEMVLRVAKIGQHVGKSFYGCANYPKCTQTVEVN